MTNIAIGLDTPIAIACKKSVEENDDFFSPFIFLCFNGLDKAMDKPIIIRIAPPTRKMTFS